MNEPDDDATRRLRKWAERKDLFRKKSLSRSATHCSNAFVELIYEEGECVCSLHWDSGGPGSGAGVQSIYKFKNEYWYYSIDEGLSGPFGSLAEAIDGFGVTDSTEAINCTELTAAEIAKQIEVYQAERGHRVQINGEEWEVSPDGRLEHAEDHKPQSGDKT